VMLCKILHRYLQSKRIMRPNKETLDVPLMPILRSRIVLNSISPHFQNRHQIVRKQCIQSPRRLSVFVHLHSHKGKKARCFEWKSKHRSRHWSVPFGNFSGVEYLEYFFTISQCVFKFPDGHIYMVSKYGHPGILLVPHRMHLFEFRY
jgi:hypothetical protein